MGFISLDIVAAPQALQETSNRDNLGLDGPEAVKRPREQSQPHSEREAHDVSGANARGPTWPPLAVRPTATKALSSEDQAFASVLTGALKYGKSLGSMVHPTVAKHDATAYASAIRDFARSVGTQRKLASFIAWADSADKVATWVKGKPADTTGSAQMRKLEAKTCAGVDIWNRLRGSAFSSTKSKTDDELRPAFNSSTQRASKGAVVSLSGNDERVALNVKYQAGLKLLGDAIKNFAGRHALGDVADEKSFRGRLDNLIGALLEVGQDLYLGTKDTEQHTEHLQAGSKELTEYMFIQ